MSFAFAMMAMANSGEENPQAENNWILSTGEHIGTNAGIKVTKDGALRLGTYFAMVRNIADDLGKMPVKKLRRIDKNNRELDDQSIEHFLVHDEPNPDMNPIDFFATVTHHACTWGNGFAHIERDGSGKPRALMPIHPSRVTIGRNGLDRLAYQVAMGDGKKPIMVQDRDMINIHGLAPDGVRGYGWSIYAKESIAIGLQAEKYASRVFANDAMPSTAVLHKGTGNKAMGPDAVKNFKRKWNQIFQGSDRSSKMVVLTEDMDVKRLDMPPEEAQMIAARDYQTKDIAKWGRMPLPKLQEILGYSSYASLTELDRQYVNECLGPWAVRWQQELKRKLIPPNERKIAYFKIFFDSLLRGSPTERAQVHRTYFHMGKSYNEIAALEDWDNIGETGDARFIPRNLYTMEAAIEARDKTAIDQGGEPDSGDSAQNKTDFEAEEIHMPLIVEAIQRVYNKAANAVMRRAGDDKDYFASWVKNFAEQQERYLIEALTLPVGAAAQAINTDSDTERIIEDAAEKHKINLEREAVDSHAAGSLNGIAESWRGGNYADSEAKRIITEIKERVS